MVTSNKQTDKKVVKMTAQNNTAVVPHRTLLGEVNEHITCPLCRGYYIDATTIVECLHSFCRSCIIKHLQVKKYCPVCEMMINSAKPNIKLDKALQDIVYKLVPGLFQKEMERRQTFYASRPGPAASATPEQRGEDTERIIFSPEDVISFSLEYSDVTDSDSISSKSSDSNEPQLPTTARRYLQCPAVVNISHLKKFLSMKFDIDSTQFAIDILYKRVPLPDYYTLMDIAYIYNWKRNEPMRFFYQIIDYVAIRNRLFDVNRKSTQVQDKKSITAVQENASVHLHDHLSETSSGTNSPMPDDSSVNKGAEIAKKDNQLEKIQTKEETHVNKRSSSPPKKSDDEDEKSQFLNSFELTAKSNAKSPPKTNPENFIGTENISKISTSPKVEDSLKRKYQTNMNLPELKKVKIELEKAKIPGAHSSNNPSPKSGKSNEKVVKNIELNVSLDKGKTTDSAKPIQSTSSSLASAISRDNKMNHSQSITLDKQPETGQKRAISEGQVNLTPKRKPEHITSVQKTVSPLKIQLSKTEAPTLISNKAPDTPKMVTKKIPDLKPSTPNTVGNKTQNLGKLRMDLLANNSDPTIDRSKILSQVKTSASSGAPNTGDNLKSLFDSCKINIPSSLSITLTDQKSPSDLPISEQKKGLINKNLANANNLTGHKVPSPPVHNYIEIKKLPDTDLKKINKSEGFDSKPNLPKSDSANQTKPLKTNETSAKGPIPNLKPIADTKLAKQAVNLGSAPITFQQTFEQQLQSLQSDSKNKVPKNKSQVPKLVPATPKTFSAANKLSNSTSKALTAGPTGVTSGEIKSTTALDLSTPHTIQSQLGPQQTKAFETMQSIANLAKKQNLPPKSTPVTMAQNIFPSLSRPTSAPSPLRIPPGSSPNQIKQEKSIASIPQNITNHRQDLPKQINTIKQANQSHTNTSTGVPSPNYQGSQPSSSSMQPSPRSQTRSPSLSPKLVIAEEKHTSNILEQSHSNLGITSQLSSMFASKSESHKDLQSMTKPGLKPLKPLVPPGKIPGIRQPITPNLNVNTPMSSQADYLSQPLISQALFRHQMDMQHAWLKAQRQFDLYKNMPNMAHQNQNDFNNKDNKNV
ncbi:unnamed protein product [Pieris brassicae]|uniref:RING-type domain-containing protein n=1 Tax=Pieris brassicae TaxID=7116 RepID=A0A9P0T105_PIEBR|nr:unnamed protein product [Pieris brassicae]